MTVEAPHLTVLPDHVVAVLPWEDLHDATGVRTKVLWRSAGSLAGLMRLLPGAALPSHAHAEGHHHILVKQGSCEVNGSRLTEGAYVHVAAGEPHHVANRSDDSCEVFYLYVSS